MKQHISPRTLRRAAERKARKEAHKALKLQEKIEAKTLAATATASISDQNDTHESEPVAPPNETETNPKISDARLNANRANSKLSRGPKTETGRITSSQNRRVHGLTPGCRFLILPTEDAGAFEQLRQNLIDEHNPISQSEVTIVEDMARHIWLRERGYNFQNQAIDEDSGEIVDDKKFFLYERYAAGHDAAFKSCFVTLSRIRKERELVRLGFERKQIADMKFEIRENVQRAVEEVQKTDDWVTFNDKMFAFREYIAQKYRRAD